MCLRSTSIFWKLGVTEVEMIYYMLLASAILPCIELAVEELGAILRPFAQGGKEWGLDLTRRLS